MVFNLGAMVSGANAGWDSFNAERKLMEDRLAQEAAGKAFGSIFGQQPPQEQSLFSFGQPQGGGLPPPPVQMAQAPMAPEGPMGGPPPGMMPQQGPPPPMLFDDRWGGGPNSMPGGASPIPPQPPMGGGGPPPGALPGTQPGGGPMPGPPQGMPRGSPPGMMPQQQGPQAGLPQLDLRTLAQRIQQTNPNLPPQIMFQALVKAAPLLNADGKLELARMGLEMRRYQGNVRADQKDAQLDQTDQKIDIAADAEQRRTVQGAERAAIQRQNEVGRTERAGAAETRKREQFDTTETRKREQFDRTFARLTANADARFAQGAARLNELVQSRLSREGRSEATRELQTLTQLARSSHNELMARINAQFTPGKEKEKVIADAKARYEQQVQQLEAYRARIRSGGGAAEGAGAAPGAAPKGPLVWDPATGEWKGAGGQGANPFSAEENSPAQQLWNSIINPTPQATGLDTTQPLAANIKPGPVGKRMRKAPDEVKILGIEVTDLPIPESARRRNGR